MAFDTAYTACETTMVVGTGADACSDTAAASTMTGDSVFTGTTLLAGDHRSTTCDSSNTGPDVTHRWTATTAGMYAIDTFGSEFDTVLGVFDGCMTATAMELECNDDGYMMGRLSLVTRTFTAGETVQIVVDGYGLDDAGRYRVNIHAM